MRVYPLVDDAGAADPAKRVFRQKSWSIGSRRRVVCGWDTVGSYNNEFVQAHSETQQGLTVPYNCKIPPGRLLVPGALDGSQTLKTKPYPELKRSRQTRASRNRRAYGRKAAEPGRAIDAAEHAVARCGQ